MTNLKDKINFSGKTILVMGGSKGIGKAIVEEFAELGGQVFFTYRSADAAVENLQVWAREHGFLVKGIQADSLDPVAYRLLLEIIETHGAGLDILVNNVGDAVRRSTLPDSDDMLWQNAWDLNVLSAVRATRIFLPLLKRSKDAVIINMSSIAAFYGGAGDSLHYATSKAAIVVFTRGLVTELKGFSVRVVGIAPSIIDTDFQIRHSSKERLEKIAESTPLGRIGTAQEVADLAIFLASPGASYITGETIMLTGGRR